MHIVPTLPWRFVYWIFAKIEKTLTICVIFSVFSLQSLHSGVSFILSNEYLMALTCGACSWTAYKRLSVSRLSSAIPIYFHHQWFLFLSETNHEELFLFSQMLFSPLLHIWTIINFLSFSSGAAAMIGFSLSLRTYSIKFSLSSLTQSSMLTSFLPPSLLDRYNHAPFDHGYSAPYMTIIFLVFRFISFTSSFVYPIMRVLYPTISIIHVLIAWNPCSALISI